jgi:hypothetical protein
MWKLYAPALSLIAPFLLGYEHLQLWKTLKAEGELRHHCGIWTVPSLYSAYARFRSSCMSFTAEGRDAFRVPTREVVSSQSLSRNQARIVKVQGKGFYHLSAIAGLLLHMEG